MSRKLELKHIFHVEEFSVTVKDDNGRSAELVFKKNTAEMNEENRKNLEAIVREKYAMTIAGLP